ncbi:MAG: hypothetical protein LBL66_07040, partial [Clostridiales bacterium]|nr:hypothetical protein [Clostridiales bacterium]
MAKQFNRENEKSNLGVIVVIFASAAALLACILPGLNLIKGFLLGVFGVFAYILFAGALALGVMRYFDVPVKVSKKKAVLLFALFFLTLAVTHMIFDWSLLSGKTFSEYAAAVYEKKWTAGGIFAGVALLAYPLSAGIGPVGALIAYLFTIALLTLAALDFKWPAQSENRKEKPARPPEEKAVRQEKAAEKIIVPLTETHFEPARPAPFKSAGPNLYVGDVEPRPDPAPRSVA